MDERIPKLIQKMVVPGQASEAAEALVEVGTASVEPLLAVLRDRKRFGLGRVYSAIALGKLADVRAIPELERVLADVHDSWEVRRRAAWALGEIGDPRSEHSLMYALKSDPNPDVRGFSAVALGKIGSISAIPELISHLTDMDEMDNFSPVAIAAIEALGVLGGNEAEAALLGVIKSWRPAASVTNPVGRLFGLITNTAAPSQNDLLCVSAAHILGSHGSHRVLAKLRHLRDGTQSLMIKRALEDAIKQLNHRAQAGIS